MAYQIQVKLQAELEMEEAIAWYESQSLGLGVEFLIEFLSLSDAIASKPSFFTMKSPPFRRALMKKFPYAIYYAVNDQKQEVVILSVWHVKRDPEKLKKRLK
jgi:plasmid stabilization system protein ParE